MGSLHEYEWLDGRYRLKKKIGKGSFGEVWLVYDNQLNIDVAAKVCFALNAQGNDDLKKEYTSTAELNHPNLLHPSYFGVSGDRSYIIMPYCPTTATNLIGCCNEMMVWMFIRDVANGLAYLHEHDIVHHDIKPDNILIGEDGRFKITDFGVSTQLRDLMHNENEEVKGGAEGYMGPEMFEADAKSVFATDIWALGATVYEMLTGELPFYGLGGRAQIDDSKPVEIPFQFISDNLVQLVRDCMAKETWNRPKAQEIADYTRILFDENVDHPEWKEYFRQCRMVEDPLISVDPPEPKLGSKRKLWWIPAAAAVIAGIILALVYSPNGPKREKDMNTMIAQPSEEIPSTDSVEKVVVAEATYLKVNGSENPKTITIASNDTLMVVNVDTDGRYTINGDMPQWLSLSTVTDTSFVLHLQRNNTAQKHTKTLEIKSGDIVRKITIVHDANKAKKLKSQLRPAAPEIKPAAQQEANTQQ